MFLRLLISVLCICVAAPVSSAAEETLRQALKKIFATPTPTPHRKKKSAIATKKKSPTPTPSLSPKKKRSPTSEESPTPSPTASPKKKRTPATEEETPTPTPKKKKIPPTPTPTGSPRHKKKGSPTPEPFETPEGSTSPAPSPQESPPPPPTSTPKLHAPNATLLPNQIKGFENYPLKVQKLLTSALELTTRNLDYKYGSADPTTGGMDCSGFVYYVLKQNEVSDVPRDSSQQYVWLRRARQFESVLSEKDDSFELDDLKPGDLLFWTGTYSIQRDPPITHAMIYLGREKKTGNRVMIGASDGRVYQGESRWGVSVFDFKIQRRETNGEGKLRPTFIGYGHIPGLQD
jgi:peptidoglycan DL-endopeptidase CwlO